MTNPFATVDFLYELGELRNIKRNYPYGGSAPSVAEHTLRVTYIAMILARQTGADVAKTIQMALMHDLAEIRTGDANPWQKPYVQTNDKAALHDMLEGTGLEDFNMLADEYKTRESLEAKIVKDADMIDTELEMRELRELGSKCLDFFEAAGVRDQLEDRMRTEAGKALFHQLRQRRPLPLSRIAPSKTTPTAPS